MGGLYAPLFKHVLSRLNAEFVHRMAVHWLSLLQRAPGGLSGLSMVGPAEDTRLQVTLWGLPFANPLGIAAGLDKDARFVGALLALGFSHVEVGTVTPRPQPGNPRPRVWRFVPERALVNAMGFPSDGLDVTRKRLRQLMHSRPNVCVGANRVVGVNLGKNRDTSLDRAHEDYATLVDGLFDVADYFVLNVSSPNTPNLRDLQATRELEILLEAAQAANRRIAEQRGAAARPILVKLAPDLEDGQIKEIAQGCANKGVSGFVATNTTLDRSQLSAKAQTLPGGTSGRPLKRRAREVVSLIYKSVDGRIPIIGVGGVEDAQDVLDFMRAGASLVQMYTGFIYGGPKTARRIIKALVREADIHGWDNITHLIGNDA